MRTEATAGGSNLLDAIVAAARRTLEARMARCPRVELARIAGDREPRGQAFAAALAGAGTINIIAECKRRSPSRGVLAASYDPVDLARRYERGGATAISVLTEPTFFDGSLDHLAAVRAATALPLLRKDFIVDGYQLIEARAAGADAVLLIAAVLGPAALRALIEQAGEQGLATLVEVHDEVELEYAVEAGARTIGVNSRNLRTMEVQASRLVELAARLPAGATAVAESGLTSADEIRALRSLGYRAFLVGERLVTSADPAALLAEMTGAPDQDRRARQVPGG